MVFQCPNPFPLTVFDNLTYGLRGRGTWNKHSLAETIEISLKSGWLWNNLKDKLKIPALASSLEQQQRLCLARVLAVEPEVILRDEPCSALEPSATGKIEELMFELKKEYTVVIVTHICNRQREFLIFLVFFSSANSLNLARPAKFLLHPKMKEPRTILLEDSDNYKNSSQLTVESLQHNDNSRILILKN